MVPHARQGTVTWTVGVCVGVEECECGVSGSAGSCVQQVAIHQQTWGRSVIDSKGALSSGGVQRRGARVSRGGASACASVRLAFSLSSLSVSELGWVRCTRWSRRRDGPRRPRRVAAPLGLAYSAGQFLVEARQQELLQGTRRQKVWRAGAERCGIDFCAASAAACD